MRKLVFLSVLVALMLAPAVFAVEKTVNFYGSARVATFVESRDSEWLHNNGDSWSDSDTTWDKEDWTSRFGANFALGNVTGKVEIRPNDGGYVRHWYGAWNFGGGTLVVGRTWAPTFVGLYGSNIAGNYWGDFDMAGSLRPDGLQVWIPVGGGTLKIGAFTPNTTAMVSDNHIDTDSDIDGDTWEYTQDVDTTLPKLEVSFDTKMSNVAFGFFAGYNSTDVELHNTTVGERDLTASYDSWIAGGWFNVDLKPAYLKGGIRIGENIKNYGDASAPAMGLTATYTFTGADAVSVNDVDYLGYGLVLGFAANDKLNFEAWYWHNQSEREYTDSGDNINYTTEGDNYGVMATFTLAPGVFICPEIARNDRGDSIITVNGEEVSNTPNGTSTIYGIYWQINF